MRAVVGREMEKAPNTGISRKLGRLIKNTDLRRPGVGEVIKES